MHEIGFYERCYDVGLKFLEKMEGNNKDNKNESNNDSNNNNNENASENNKKKYEHRPPYVFTNKYNANEKHGLGYHQDDVDHFSVVALFTDDFGDGALTVKDKKNKEIKVELSKGDAVVLAKGNIHMHANSQICIFAYSQKQTVFFLCVCYGCHKKINNTTQHSE